MKRLQYNPFLARNVSSDSAHKISAVSIFFGATLSEWSKRIMMRYLHQIPRMPQTSAFHVVTPISNRRKIQSLMNRVKQGKYIPDLIDIGSLRSIAWNFSNLKRKVNS